MEIFSDTFTIESGVDAIHADKSLVIHDGQIKVINSFEVLESREVTINGGTIKVTAVLDAIDFNGDIVINGGDITLTILRLSRSNKALDASG